AVRRGDPPAHRVLRRPADHVRPGPRPAWHGFPAADLAGPGLGAVRHDHHLRPARRAARRPARPHPGARRRHRREPAGHHPPVPPRGRLGRRHARLRRRGRAQAATARPRGRPPGGLMVTAANWSADWGAVRAELDEAGCARTPRLLTPEQCRDLAALYDKPELFRSTIDMARHRFGSGQYRYFTHDLPGPVRELREWFYPHLLPIARDWAGRLGRPRGRTRWGSGWRCATGPGRARAPRSCCATRPATGTPCTATCSATWSS